jgi:hypothetical protein
VTALVVARATPGLESQAGIRPHADRQDVVLLQMVLRHCEALSRRQFVVGVERGRMAHDAALPLESLLSSLSKSVELVRVRRRLKRVNVETQSVELLIAVTVRLSEGRIQLVGARQRLLLWPLGLAESS